MCKHKFSKNLLFEKYRNSKIPTRTSTNFFYLFMKIMCLTSKDIRKLQNWMPKNKNYFLKFFAIIIYNGMIGILKFLIHLLAIILAWIGWPRLMFHRKNFILFLTRKDSLWYHFSLRKISILVSVSKVTDYQWLVSVIFQRTLNPKKNIAKSTENSFI